MATATSSLLNVLIYSGPGTCIFSVKQTFRTLKHYLSNSYDVKLISSDLLKNELIPWDENCALFVIPGGRDLGYMEELDGSVLNRIKSKIEMGQMRYLGICAGAYFGSDRIEFAKGRKDYEIIQDRPLKLFNCPAVGPIGNFYYSDDPAATESEIKESLQAISVKTNDLEEFKVAYNGGCYFDSVDSTSTVIAKYAVNDKAAIISTDKVCLSGVHLEYDPLDCLSHNDSIFTELLKYEAQRRGLLSRILNNLGLIVKESNDPVETVQIFTNLNGVSFPNVSIAQTDDLPAYKAVPNLLFSRVTSSTQTILMSSSDCLDRLPNFTVYVADRQETGKGRSSNLWISSPSCLQFTLKLEHCFEKASQLPLIQFLMALSVTECVNSQKSATFDSKIVAKIKWPNDVYLYRVSDHRTESSIGKISGVLVNCLQSHFKKVFHVLIGVGTNILSNPSLPNITHLNDHLTVKLEKEPFLVEIIERFKYYHGRLMNFNEFPFKEYYSNWIHSGQMIESNDFPGKMLKIKGIDEFGYLVVEEGETCQVFKFEPDGNSFDMMKNLIQRK